MRKKIRALCKCAAAFSVILFIAIGVTSQFLPGEFYRTEQGHSIDVGRFVGISRVDPSASSGLRSVSTEETNGYQIRYKLMGIFPIKDARVTVVSETKVVPGGMPFGIKMLTDGVVVVGLADIRTSMGNASPAAEAGLKLGDVILSVNSKKVTTNEEVGEVIAQSGGKPSVIEVRRKNMTFLVQVTPVLSEDDGKYKAGIWVRDSTAGIGTLTFYNPKDRIFGGLGHAICDIDTAEILPLMSGKVGRVTIQSVKKGSAGFPGELRGAFVPDGDFGNLLLNDEIGVFGQLSGSIDTTLSAVPITFKQDIKEGEATIRTTINGSVPKEYKIMIEKVYLAGNNRTKNMVIKIIDKELLEKTGGIVQGMSGSPILQNGKLVGAVTHVFVNDPIKGYGIFAENMLNYVEMLKTKSDFLAS